MGLFDLYGDLMQQVGETMRMADPFGPVGAAGEMVTSLFAVQDIAAEHGRDALWNLAGNIGDFASVAQAMLPLAKQTLIIEGGLKLVSAMEDQCGGTNAPTEGDSYSEGARRFNRISDTLKSATPGDDWKGSASDSYHQANDRQRERARLMVDADLEVRMALSAEAGEVRAIRRTFNKAATVMGNAIVPALAARALGKHGKAIAYGIETGAVGAALPVCIWQMTQLAEHSTRAAATLKDAVLLYEAVAKAEPPIRM